MTSPLSILSYTIYEKGIFARFADWIIKGNQMSITDIRQRVATVESESGLKFYKFSTI
jgi:hypothetical protein